MPWPVWHWDFTAVENSAKMQGGNKELNSELKRQFQTFWLLLLSSGPIPALIAPCISLHGASANGFPRWQMSHCQGFPRASLFLFIPFFFLNAMAQQAQPGHIGGWRPGACWPPHTRALFSLYWVLQSWKHTAWSTVFIRRPPTVTTHFALPFLLSCSCFVGIKNGKRQLKLHFLLNLLIGRKNLFSVFSSLTHSQFLTHACSGNYEPGLHIHHPLINELVHH